ncbi:TerB family tellurite resistance protein [Thalassospira sp. TSL5-1]|uniref:TerB family tellurite resistance protein n=1 Tax=Thalassospira sp. TSL5-1 TaxID=1544451 RepID=UPI00093E23A1|nr:TerB family tellurite resistance protein [Thalassospira sp. TSL5-1]OKH88216.1 molecular chaperone DnaJ [Thalassospira sp. TSL5-1]
MSIWGKIIGGAAGFALGGPLGAILGAAAGHMVDKANDGDFSQERISSGGPWGQHSGGNPWGQRTGQYGGQFSGQFGGADPRQVAFATGVIVLSAKMAKADGTVTREEIDAFKRLFRVTGPDAAQVGQIFDAARRSPDGYEPYAQQIAQMFAGERAVLESILEALHQIALADGTLHPAEKEYLRKVAMIFGFEDVDFDRVHQGSTAPRSEQDPYKQLGLTRSASNEELKAAHRKLSRENHPDLLMAKGMPEEFVEQANEKMARINAAWDQICKERHI